MSYDPMLEGMLAMAIGMSTGSASEGLEAVQNAEQNRARSNCRLPKTMNPSKVTFEGLGFTFEDIDGDDVLCKSGCDAAVHGRAEIRGYRTDAVHSGIQRGEGRHQQHRNLCVI